MTFVARFVEIAFKTLRAKIAHVYAHAKPRPNTTYDVECVAWMYALLAELVAALGGGNMYEQTRADKFVDALAKFCDTTLRKVETVVSGAAPEIRAEVRAFVEDHAHSLNRKDVEQLYLKRAFSALSKRSPTRSPARFAALLDTYLRTVSSYRLYRQLDRDVRVFVSCRHTVHMLVTLKLLDAGKLRYPQTYSAMVEDACKSGVPAAELDDRLAALDKLALDIVDPPTEPEGPADPAGPADAASGYSLQDIQDLIDSGSVDCPCPDSPFMGEAMEASTYGRYFDTFCDVFLDLYLKHLQAQPRRDRDDVVAAVAHVLTCCWNVADVRLVPLSAGRTEALRDFRALAANVPVPELTRSRIADESLRIKYNTSVVSSFVDGIVNNVSDPFKLKVALTECVEVVRELAKAHASEGATEVSVQHLRFPQRADVFPDETAWRLVSSGVSPTCGLTREHGELMMHLAYARKSTHSLAPYFARHAEYRRFLSAQTDAFLERARAEAGTDFRESAKLARNLAELTYVKGTDLKRTEKELAGMTGGRVYAPDLLSRWAPAAVLALVTLAASCI